MGEQTRGTTNPNRLRRVDRWLTGPASGWRARPDPLVVDLGYGASPVTTVELADRLRTVCPGVQVLGLEIDPQRVAAAQGLRRAGLDFGLGGFELPAPRRPVLVRAMNVLRQYDEAQVRPAWQTLQAGLAEGGLLVDGTCDELGRRSAWVALDAAGPVSLTVSLRLADLVVPSQVAERLPKALIHHNLPGRRVHDFLQALDDAWHRQAPLSVFGARQRFTATAAAVRAAGWPVRDGPARWRLGELTVDWSAVEP